MKMWRVYKYFGDGQRPQCAHRSYDRQSAESMALILTLMHLPGVTAVEMRSPDGRYWTRELPPPGTTEEIAAAEARLRSMSPEELGRRKSEVVSNICGFFSAEEPPVSPMVQRVMAKFRARLAERYGAGP